VCLGVGTRIADQDTSLLKNDITLMTHNDKFLFLTPKVSSVWDLCVCVCVGGGGGGRVGEGRGTWNGC
jgi:hypothetical protein